jgi:hypothetical protein
MREIEMKWLVAMIDFNGLYCRDCMYYCQAPNGGGTCSARDNKRLWPGDRICTKFAQ